MSRCPTPDTLGKLAGNKERKLGLGDLVAPESIPLRKR